MDRQYPRPGPTSRNPSLFLPSRRTSGKNKKRNIQDLDIPHEEHDVKKSRTYYSSNHYQDAEESFQDEKPIISGEPAPDGYHDYGNSAYVYDDGSQDYSFSTNTNQDHYSHRNSSATGLAVQDGYDAEQEDYGDAYWPDAEGAADTNYSNAEDPPSESGLGYNQPFEEESDSEAEIQPLKTENDASTLFVQDDDEFQQFDENTTVKDRTDQKVLRSVHFEDDHHDGLGESCLQKAAPRTARPPPPKSQKDGLQPLHRAPSQPQPIRDVRNSNNARQTFGNNPGAHAPLQDHRNTRHGVSQAQKIPREQESRTIVNNRLRDPRLLAGPSSRVAQITPTAFSVPSPRASPLPQPKAQAAAVSNSRPMSRPSTQMNRSPVMQTSSTPKTYVNSQKQSMGPPSNKQRSRTMRANATPLAPTNAFIPPNPNHKPKSTPAQNSYHPRAGSSNGNPPINNIGRTAGDRSTDHQISQDPRKTVLAQQHDMPEDPHGFTDDHVRKFEPDDMDRQIFDWKKRKNFTWTEILSLLRYGHQQTDLHDVKIRYSLMERKMAQEKEDSRMNHPADGGEPRSEVQSIQRLNTGRSSSVASPKVGEEPNAVSVAVMRQKDRLAWQEEKNSLLESQRRLEQELAVEKQRSERLQLDLDQERFALESKTYIEDDLSRMKDEVDGLRSKLNDEQLLRKKAEQDLKEHKKTEQRRQLAQAAASRSPAKAINTGFKFSKDNTSDDEDKARAVKRPNSRKKTPSNSTPRKDGHPEQGGKQITQKMYQQYMKHMEKSNGEELEELGDPEIEKIDEENLTYFVYTLRRKQWLRTEEEPDVEGMVCSQYTYLNKANEAAQREIFRPWGTDGIVIEHDKDFTLSGGKDEDGMCWTQIELPAGFVKVWVEREIHTDFEGELPKFEPKGFLSRNVYVVKQEHDGNVEDMEDICTVFDLANKKASDKLLHLLWGGKPNRIDDIVRKSQAEKEMKQKLEDLEDHKQLFFEEVEGEEGHTTKIWVEKRKLIGPRN